MKSKEDKEFKQIKHNELLKISNQSLFLPSILRDVCLSVCHIDVLYPNG